MKLLREQIRSIKYKFKFFGAKKISTIVISQIQNQTIN